MQWFVVMGRFAAIVRRVISNIASRSKCLLSYGTFHVVKEHSANAVRTDSIWSVTTDTRAATSDKETSGRIKDYSSSTAWRCNQWISRRRGQPEAQKQRERMKERRLKALRGVAISAARSGGCGSAGRWHLLGARQMRLRARPLILGTFD